MKESSTYYSLFPLSNLGKNLHSIASQLNKNEQCTLLFGSENHLMAINLQRKSTAEQDNYVIKFYDPNITSSHLRILCKDLNTIRELKPNSEFEKKLTKALSDAYFPMHKAVYLFSPQQRNQGQQPTIKLDTEDMKNLGAILHQAIFNDLDQAIPELVNTIVNANKPERLESLAPKTKVTRNTSIQVGIRKGMEIGLLAGVAAGFVGILLFPPSAILSLSAITTTLIKVGYLAAGALLGIGVGAAIGAGITKIKNKFFNKGTDYVIKDSRNETKAAYVKAIAQSPGLSHTEKLDLLHPNNIGEDIPKKSKEIIDSLRQGVENPLDIKKDELISQLNHYLSPQIGLNKIIRAQGRWARLFSGHLAHHFVDEAKKLIELLQKDDLQEIKDFIEEAQMKSQRTNGKFQKILNITFQFVRQKQSTKTKNKPPQNIQGSTNMILGEFRSSSSITPEQQFQEKPDKPACPENSNNSDQSMAEKDIAPYGDNLVEEVNSELSQPSNSFGFNAM